MYVCTYVRMYVRTYVLTYVCTYVRTYVGLPKNSGNLTIKKFPTVTRSVHHPRRRTPLGHVYSDPSVFPTISCIPGSSKMCVDNLLRFCVDLLIRVKTTPFQP